MPDRYLRVPVPEFLHALGPGIAGQRFHRPGGPPGLYAASDRLTATAESIGLSGPLGLVEDAEPTVEFALKMDLKQCVDLTNKIIQEALETTREELMAPWKLLGGNAPTQILGQALFDSGRFDGIKYESSKRPGYNCFLIFTSLLATTGGSVAISDSSGNQRGKIP
ncbi:MAG: RES family NAD+ phosphorylase [Verrucomicrobia bacterium]|nr:RES family NAD+ phosphorylase [Verrucomicrobiota bacterium]